MKVDIIKTGFLMMWSAVAMMALGVMGLWIGLIRLGWQIDQLTMQIQAIDGERQRWEDLRREQ